MLRVGDLLLDGARTTFSASVLSSHAPFVAGGSTVANALDAHRLRSFIGSVRLPRAAHERRGGMRFPHRNQVLVSIAVVCMCGGLLTAPCASAATVNVNALARIAYVGSTGGALQFAGTVSDPAVGTGGLLATVHVVSGGYGGSAAIVSASGSLTGTVRATARPQGDLVQLSLTDAVTAATGRLAGARGTLTGSATVTATGGVGELRLRGTLRGAGGRPPAPLSGEGVRHVNGRFQGAELSLARSGVLTVVGSVTGLVRGPAVLVAHERATTTSARGTLTVFAAGGTLTGAFDVRFPVGSQVRSETGTWTFTGGSGDLRGAHTTSPITLRGTRDLVTELIALRIRGAFTP